MIIAAFFKWDGKVTKIKYLLFHRIWKKVLLTSQPRKKLKFLLSKCKLFLKHIHVLNYTDITVALRYFWYTLFNFPMGRLSWENGTTLNWKKNLEIHHVEMVFKFNFSPKTLILDLIISRFSRLIFPWEISRQRFSRFPVSREKMRCLVKSQMSTIKMRKRVLKN